MVLGGSANKKVSTENLYITSKDRAKLQKLAERIAEIANSPAEQEKREMWYRHNRLERVKPMILTYPDNSWKELIPEHTLVTEGYFARKHEMNLRMQIFAHEHWNDDNPVEAVVFSDMAIHDSGFGIDPQAERTGHANGSRHFIPVIVEEEDIDKIMMPVLRLDEKRTEEEYQLTTEVFGNFLEVRRRGINQIWCAMMDQFVEWRGIENLLLDMYDRPEWLHAVMEKMTAGWISRIEQAEKLGLFTIANKNEYVGSGGVAYINELPQNGFDGQAVRSIDLWGQAAAQILTTVSPQMHDEFALQYEAKILSRFGLNCYGCCEALHHKMDYVKKIPNLRRVSMSPWVNIDKAVEAVGDKFVFSSKPNPEIILHSTFDREAVEKDIVMRCEKTRDCVVEIILKDVHTCKNDPHRLTEWTRIAQEVSHRYA